MLLNQQSQQNNQQLYSQIPAPKKLAFSSNLQITANNNNNINNLKVCVSTTKTATQSINSQLPVLNNQKQFINNYSNTSDISSSSILLSSSSSSASSTNFGK
jgi:hypothetical protein